MNYESQSLLDNKALGEGRVSLFGEGSLLENTVTYLAALGVGRKSGRGRILAFSEQEAYTPSILYTKNKDDTKRKNQRTLAEIINAGVNMLNSDTAINAFHASPLFLPFQEGDAVIEVSNNYEYKKKFSDELVKNLFEKNGHHERSTLFISASSDELSSLVLVYRVPSDSGERRRKLLELIKDKEHIPRLFRRYYDKSQGIISSAAASAIIAEAVRETLSPLKYDKPLNGIYTFLPVKKGGFSEGWPSAESIVTYRKIARSSILNNKNPFFSLEGRRFLVAGAGGVGSPLSYFLAMLGASIDIFDKDTVEEKNLNRQIFYARSIGKNKAEILSERLNNIIGAQNLKRRGKIRGFPLFINERILNELSKNVKYDAVFGCTDNWQSKKDLNEYSRRNRTPLIIGAITGFKAYAEGYFPGRNKCFDCRYDFSTIEEAHPPSCAVLNVIMNNVVASIYQLMILQNYYVFPDAENSRWNRVQMYSINNPKARFYERSIILAGEKTHVC